MDARALKISNSLKAYWQAQSPEVRSEVMRHRAKMKHKQMTVKQRSLQGRKMVLARWAKKKLSPT